MTVTPDELARWTEGEVTQARAAEIEQAVRATPALEKELERLQWIRRVLGESDSALSKIDLTSAVRQGIGREAPRKRAWLPFVLVACAASFTGIVLLPNAQEFRAKGAATNTFAAIHAYAVARSGRADPVAKTISADAALLFAYDNAGPSPFAYVMVFAVDSVGEVHWYQPAYLDANSDPVSVPIVAGAGRPLADAVRHPLPSGELRLNALFTRAPESVHTIEKRLAAKESPRTSSDDELVTLDLLVAP